MSGKRALTANHRHDTGCLDEGRSAEPPFPTSSLPRRSRPASLLFSRLKSARHAMQKARRMAWPRAIPWWSVRDLNPRPCACKAPALPLRQPTLRARRPAAEMPLRRGLWRTPIFPQNPTPRNAGFQRGRAKFSTGGSTGLERAESRGCAAFGPFPSCVRFCRRISLAHRTDPLRVSGGFPPVARLLSHECSRS